MVFGLSFDLSLVKASSSSKEKRLRVELLEEIGSGSYAKVFKAKRIENGPEPQFFAAKVINLQKAPKDFVQKFLPRELSICKQVDHPNLVKTFDVLNNPKKIVILMSYAGKGDLLTHCRLIGAMRDDQCRPIFKQIVYGIEYLHNSRIIHRDLKCENILLCMDDIVKIADFGFARTMDNKIVSRTFCGSAAYAAPELLKGKAYSGFASDIWSLGCILFVMACSMMPFRDENITILTKEQKSPPVIPSHLRKKVNPVLIEFINRLLAYEHKARLSVKDIKQSPWFKA